MRAASMLHPAAGADAVGLPVQILEPHRAKSEMACSEKPSSVVNMPFSCSTASFMDVYSMPIRNSMTSSLRAIVIHLTCGDGPQVKSSQSSIEIATRAASRLQDFHVPIITSLCRGSAEGAARSITIAANHVIATREAT